MLGYRPRLRLRLPSHRRRGPQRASAPPEHKERYLRPIIAGKIFAAEALTEPRGGSDFFGATTTAKRDGDPYVLHGQKRFIVGAEGADYFMAYARTATRARAARVHLACFLVDRDDDVEVKHVYGLMGSRAAAAPAGCSSATPAVPAGNLVGRANERGRIFYRMMIPERLTSAARRAGRGPGRDRGRLPLQHTRRRAFGMQIQRLPGGLLQDSRVRHRARRGPGLVYATARAIDSGKVPAGRLRRMVSESKKFSTEMAWHVVNHAMQVMGGIGYTNVYPIERLLATPASSDLDRHQRDHDGPHPARRDAAYAAEGISG